MSSVTSGVQLQASASSQEQRRLVVGLTGYPNVGKSSTINALFGELRWLQATADGVFSREPLPEFARQTGVDRYSCTLTHDAAVVDCAVIAGFPSWPGSKKTAVAATPGKTKHFQTLIISESLLLCDCPGLVLPRYAQSKADMVAAGAGRPIHCRRYISLGTKPVGVGNMLAGFRELDCACKWFQGCDVSRDSTHCSCRRHPHRLPNGCARAQRGGAAAGRPAADRARVQHHSAAEARQVRCNKTLLAIQSQSMSE